MKKIITLFIGLIAVTNAMATDISCPTVTLSGTLSTRTLYADTVYLLSGCVTAPNGVTITAQAGVVIMGKKSTDGTLIISRGAQFISQGTAMAPVIFTSNQTPGTRNPGDWGGIAVLGYAKNNQSNSITLSDNRGCSITGGGTNNNDNSGVFKYMIVEFARYGFSMVSVGDGTEFHHVEVINASENSMEMYGGTFNFKHFVSLNPKRSDILATGGNLSKGQYILGIRNDLSAYVSTGDLSNGIVFANNDDLANDFESSVGSDDQHTVLSNVSLFGPGHCGSTSYNSNFKYGVFFHQRAGGGVYNAIITGYREGLRIEDYAIENADINYTLNASQNTYFNNLLDYDPTTTSWTANCATDLDDWMLGTSPVSCRQRNNQFAPTELGLSNTLCGSFCSTSPDLLINPGATNYDLDIPRYNLAADLSNMFFDAASYRGAFDNATDWTAGWAKFCPNTDYCPQQRMGKTTGINTIIGDNSNLVVSPNPVHGIAYAEFATEQGGKVTITIVNSVGQLVRTISHDATKGQQRVAINTEGLSSGMYIINVDQAGVNAAHARIVVK